MPHLARFSAALLLATALLFGAPAAFAVDSGDIILVSAKGEVHITLNGAERNLRAGGVLELPASVRTGRDGNVELSQGATTVSVGPETLLEFPALEKRGAPIDRIVQPRGNAFYNIGKREGRKLRVETPYLVGVIKGTQFNVAAQEGSTTISLFEGLLEVRATDDSDVVDLKAGEIASRSRGDKSISIIKMDAGKVPPTSSRPPGSGSNDGAPDPVVPRANVSAGVELPLRADVDLNTDVRTSGSPVEVGTAASVSLGQSLDATTSVAVNTASTGVDVGADTSVSLGNTADLATNAAVNVGPTGADVAANVGVDAGPIATDLGTSTSIDVGAGAIDTSASTSIDAGSLTTGVAADLAVDLASGTVDTGVIVGASAPGVEVNVGSDVAVDAVAGTVNLGLDVAGSNIDLGVDIGDTGTVETVTETVTDTVVDVGGLLNGLIRRPGRK